MIIHLGDFAYDLDTNNSVLGDMYMQKMEPIVSVIPYQVAVGNHEVDEDHSYLNYRLRFNMDKTSDSLYYSWNVGLIHFIAIMSEFYYVDPKGEIDNHYTWLVHDLKMANAQRYLRPWIIVYGHRPCYCTNTECFSSTGNIRDGIPIGGELYYGLEELLYTFGVDFYFSGHEHAYERFFPLYKSNAVSTNYNDPKATIHILGGAAGNHEGASQFEGTPPAWSAFRTSSSGIGFLTIFNNTHAEWSQMGSDGTVLDQIWVVAENHGPFLNK